VRRNEQLIPRAMLSRLVARVLRLVARDLPRSALLAQLAGARPGLELEVGYDEFLEF
jgi:hypothetical protein